MKVWLISFFLIFALAQFFFWIKNFLLPFPIYILAGAFLAIASNYEHKIVSSFTNSKNKN